GTGLGSRRSEWTVATRDRPHPLCRALGPCDRRKGHSMTLRVPLVLASASLLALGACTDQYGNQVPMNRAQQGAIIGGTIGAAYGIQRDDDGSGRARDVARSAAAGALIGGLAGSALDAQARALEQSMTTPGVTVVNTGQTINVNLPESVLFAFDS